MARWTGGSESFFHLWDEVNGGEGNRVARGKKKNRWIKRRYNMKYYKGKNLQRNVSHLFECICVLCWLVYWCTTPVRELAHSTKQTVTEHILCTSSLAGPKGVKINKAHFLPEKKKSLDTTRIFLTTFSGGFGKWNCLTQRRSYFMYVSVYTQIRASLVAHIWWW